MNQHVANDESIVYVVEDDSSIRESLKIAFQSVRLDVQAFESPKDFLLAKRSIVPSCLVLDVRLPGMSGFELHAELIGRGDVLPVIFITGHADVAMGVRAIKSGAVEFLCKPFREQELLDAVSKAIRIDSARRSRADRLKILRRRYEQLTQREREIMQLIVSGMMNKQVAGKLGLSEITVKVHRASVVRKMGARSVADLVRQADMLLQKPLPSRVPQTP